MTERFGSFGGRRRDPTRVARDRLENLITGLADALGWRSYRIPRGRGVAGFPNYVMVRGNRLLFVFLATGVKRVDWRARKWFEDLKKVEFMDVVVWTEDDEETPGVELDREAKRHARYTSAPITPEKWRVP